MTARKLSLLFTTTFLAVASVAATAATMSTARASGHPATVAASPATAPEIQLVPAQSTVTAYSDGKFAFLDTGVWLESLGAPLQFNVSRASYTKPLTITQVVSGSVARPLPASLLDGWNGLKDFYNLTIVNAKGKRVGNKTLTFCPNSYDPARATDGGPLASPYPTSCGTFDPFPLGQVWGIAQDWAVDPTQNGDALFKIPVGTYKVTQRITGVWAGLLGIPAKDASVTVTVKVVKNPGSCCGPAGCCPAPVPASFAGHGTKFRPAALKELPASVPTMADPPASVLPDMVPLPSWGINVMDVGKGKHDLLNFGATVWIGGNGPLDVEGFRHDASPVMPAYQYFFDSSGQVVGKAPAGTMGFDSKKGHDHWHFQQFAQYKLLGASKQVIRSSGKIGFCIAPTDQVDLTLPGAVWQPPTLGFGGQCGSPTALWVQENLPAGWGDTYLQTAAGQAFDITNLKNGTYYIEIIANPEHVLHETDTGNDVSLRKIILSGTKGHRHVTVPAWNGIDPEKG